MLSKNSLITTVGRNFVPLFRCLSGSSTPNIGNLIGPHGADITFSTSDPFFIRRGGSYDPGTLRIQSVRALEPEDSGIYTYRTPDENGDIVEFHFGIYLSTNISNKINTVKPFKYEGQLHWRSLTSIHGVGGHPLCKIYKLV